MQRRVNVRRRIVIASAVCSILLFIFTTPVISGILTFLAPPASLQNVKIIQSIDSVKLTWNIIDSPNVKSYTVKVNERIEEIAKDKAEYGITANDTFVDNSESANISIQSNDFIGRQSQPIVFEITRITETSPLKTYEETKGGDISAIRGGQSALLLAIIVSILLSIFAGWIFQFKIKTVKEGLLVGYVGIVNFSYLFIALSFLFGSELPLGRFVLSVLLSVGFYILSYLIYLTVNILYNSLSYELPLEQAAKASQFIFSLIASYLLLIAFFSSEYRLFDKTLFVSLFVGYYSLASISMLKNIKVKDAMWRTISITMVIVFAIFVISIWPIHYIYGILAIAVIYYILLSISLENRHTLTKYTWVEYGVLLSLVFFLFVLTSNWGINGSLL